MDQHDYQSPNPRHSIAKQYLAGHEISFLSKPALPEWEKKIPADTLIAEKVIFDSYRRVYFIGCGSGMAPVALLYNHPYLDIWITEFNYTILEEAKKTFDLSNSQKININKSISLLPEQSESFDIVIVYQPKGRMLSRRLIAEAFYTLKPGGDLYLVGSNDLGIQSAVKDLHDLMQNHTIIAYKKGNRLVKSIKSTSTSNLPDWMLQPGIKPGSWITFDTEISGTQIQIYSLPGVFSADRLDRGSLFLVKHIPDLSGMRVLDFGCGYGVIGIAAALANASDVDLIDNNLLAISSAQKNITDPNLLNITVRLSDGLNAVKNNNYHFLLTNPPFHVSQKVDYSITKTFLSESHDILYPGGKLLLVANQFIRYDQWIEKVYNNVECLAFDNHYKIWQAVKKSHR